ncbi:MAG: ABC transporter ATP-binding protein, partial [Candidatus Methanomethylophilus sp.]|nr:ABC transporter ATP-binding protein [Methanomethylophilus sp.]
MSPAVAQSFRETDFRDEDVQISIRGIGKTYVRNGIETKAIENVSIDINKGELVSFIGPSGCGKTTLLNMIAGLLPPTAGAVYICNRECTEPGRDRGMVFQDFALLPWRTVKKNVELGLEIAGVPKAERSAQADEYLRIVGLEKFADAHINELSGGMKQRVGIARALIVKPDVILMDEPFGALDAQTRNLMQAQLIDILKTTKQTIIFITHSVDEAVYLSDKVVVLTKRPTTVNEVLEIPWPRPRDRSSPQFNEVKKEIITYLEHENV